MFTSRESLIVDSTRKDTFRSSRRIGETLKSSIPEREQFDVAKLLVEILSESEDTPIFPIAQGLWHGFNYEAPASMVRILAAEESA